MNIMEREKALRIAAILRNIARYSLLALGILVFVFALFSGAEEYGGGFEGLIKNSPNALPWLFLLVLVFLAWKWELVGGFFIVILGVVLFYFFNSHRLNLLSFASILSYSISFLGGFFILSWYIRED